MTKNAQGIWTVTTEPQIPGFHYYNLVIDGVSVADPSSDSFFGVNKMSSGIEFPEKGVNFYTVQNVPHGQVSSKWYFSKRPTTGENYIFIALRVTKTISIKNTRYFICNMVAVKMKPAG